MLSETGRMECSCKHGVGGKSADVDDSVYLLLWCGGQCGGSHPSD